MRKSLKNCKQKLILLVLESMGFGNNKSNKNMPKNQKNSKSRVSNNKINNSKKPSNFTNSSKDEEPLFKSSNVFSQLEILEQNIDADTDVDLEIEKVNDNKTNEVFMKNTSDNVITVNNYNNSDNDSDGWTFQDDKKTKNNKKTNYDSDYSYLDETPTYSNNYEDNNIGEHLKFVSKWNVWVHLNNSTNWTPESYKIVYKIDNISSFWSFFNNIQNLNFEKYQFYIMKDCSCPTWEHETNRDGGTCSIRLPKDRIEDVIEQLSILVLNDTFNDHPHEINGISFGIKQNWGLIKIWNSNAENDISTFVPNYLTKKYSATPRYKKNEPEY